MICKSPNSRPFPRHRIAAPKSTCSFTATIEVLRKLYSFYYSLINLWKKKLPSLAITSFAGVPCVCETWGGRIHYSLWPRLPGNSLGFSLDEKVKARSSFTRAALQWVWEVKTRLPWVQDIVTAGDQLRGSTVRVWDMGREDSLFTLAPITREFTRLLPRWKSESPFIFY